MTHHVYLPHLPHRWMTPQSFPMGSRFLPLWSDQASLPKECVYQKQYFILIVQWRMLLTFHFFLNYLLNSQKSYISASYLLSHELLKVWANVVKKILPRGTFSECGIYVLYNIKWQMGTERNCQCKELQYHGKWIKIIHIFLKSL